jgi:hypothetical protein
MARDERFLSPHDAMATPSVSRHFNSKFKYQGPSRCSYSRLSAPPVLREPWLILGVGPCRTWSKHNVATHHLLPLTVLLVLAMTQSPYFFLPPSAIPSAHLSYLLIPQAHARDADVRILFAAVATTRSDRFFALTQSQVEPKGSADGKFQCTPPCTSHNVIGPSRLHTYTTVCGLQMHARRDALPLAMSLRIINVGPLQAPPVPAG